MTEAEEQKALVSWFREFYPEYSHCIRVSLNGITLGKGQNAARRMASLKAQGLTVGESDLMFCVPSNGYHGLMIEMKTKRGRITDAQEEYLAKMEFLGYRAECCYGFADAKQVVSEYMREGPE